MSVTLTDTLSGARRSTRLVFLLVGIAMASWAPMVPYAKARLGLSEAELGLVLLGLGAGALGAMPLAAWSLARLGSRRVILVAGAITCLDLPVLAMAPTPTILAVGLLVFGAAIGTVDVAMNMHAVAVERQEGRALMSGFHGLFSLGGLLGAAGTAALLGGGLALPITALLSTFICAALLLAAWPALLRDTAAPPGRHRLRPTRAALLIGALCFIAFMTEGAMLDWSAVFLHSNRAVPSASAGLGYAAFSIAMAAGRLTGDAVIRRLGGPRVLALSASLACLGLLIAVALPNATVALAGFVLVGLGAANVVPTLFSAAGRLPDLPAHAALPVVNAIGYSGLLAGPVLIGPVAGIIGLPAALGAVGIAMLSIVASNRVARSVQGGSEA
jgi:fucose permease